MTLLRPEWLLLWLPLSYLLLRQTKRQITGWQEWVDAPLLQALTRHSPGKWPRLQTYAPWAGLFMLVLALAGPATERILPAYSLERPVVLVLDQSISMGSTDIAPSRHVRTQQKVRDWLQLHPARPTGLIVYSGTAHVVSPVTTDHRAILGFLQQTNPFIMPVFGSQPVAALHLALQLLGEEPGDILWFTDDLTASQAQQLPTLGIQQNMGVIVVGTRVGAPIPLPNGNMLQLDSGELLIPAVDTGALAQWARNQRNVRWSAVTIDDHDLQSVIPSPTQNSETRIGERRQWHDWGPFLLLFALPGLALWWRRGALFTLYCCIAWSASPSAEAANWRDWFRNPDQQGFERLTSDPQEAYNRFQDPHWKAYAALQGQDYPAAETLLSTDDSALGHYNRGHALVQQRQFEEAMAAFEAALDVDPAFAEAEHNRALLAQFLQQQTPEEPPEGEQPEDEPSSSDDNKSPEQNSGAGNDAADASSDDQHDKSSTTGNAADQGSSPATPSSTTPDTAESAPSAPNTTRGHESAATDTLEEQIRRRLPNPQQSYLQRRFRFEYDIDPQQYDAGGPLW